MINIRKRVFETNSSSTHSICISKDTPIKSDTITLRRDEYGWEEGCYDLADYFYTAVCLLEREEELMSILKALNITPVIANPDSKEFDDYYIDHYDECSDFVDAVLNDVDLLLRVLFSDAVVYTGNDNGSEYDAMCNVACGDMWDYETQEYINVCCAACRMPQCIRAAVTSCRRDS